MKSNLLFTLVVLFATISYSQTYTFSKLKVLANVETTNGNVQRVIDTKQGTFKFKFETPSDPTIKKLFTILNPGMTYNPNYYVLLEDSGYIESNNVLFQKSMYYSTENDNNVPVLFAKDKSIIVIFKSDNTINEYKR